MIALVGCRPPNPPSESVHAQADPLFDDVYPRSGIAFVVKQPRTPLSILETIGHGAGLIDVEGDGFLDLVIVGPDRVKLYRSEEGMRFRDVTDIAKLRQPGYWGGVAVGDYDNDGRPDLYLCGYNCSALYHNEGGFGFKEVTSQMGLGVRPPSKSGIPEWRTTAGFADLDNDGFLDLYVCRYAEFGPHTTHLCSTAGRPEKFSCSPDLYKPQIGSLYRNLGGKGYKDVTREAGMSTAAGRALGVAFADYNDDGWTDVAVANDERAGDLFENRGRGRFVNRGEASGTAFNSLGHVHGGMGIDWGDYDGDGLPDLFVTTYQNEAKSLYKNLGKGLFTDAALDAGLAERMDRWVGFGTKLLDYDNDGLLDIIVTSGHVINNTATIYPGTQERQPVQLFRNTGSGFEEVTDRMSDSARRLMVGRALALGDLDNDGRLDAIVTDHDGVPMILHNLVRNGNHWITLRLVGTQSARDGFGARVTVRAGSKAQIFDATNAGSYMAANDSRVHAGLGVATAADVEIRWSSGRKQIWRNLSADRFYVLTEGSAEPKRIPASAAEAGR